MFCSSCGSEISNSAIVCMKCGTPTTNFERSAKPVQSSGDHGILIVGGYIGAVLMPIIGFVTSIILLAKGRYGHGIAQLALSVFFMCFWAGFIEAFQATAF